MKSSINFFLLAFCFVPLFLSAQKEIQNPQAQQMLNKSSHNFFIENKGQWPKEVRYLARIGGMNAWITQTGVVYDYYQITRNYKPEQTLNLPPKEKEEFERQNTGMKGHVVDMVLEGANTEAKVLPSGLQEGYYNYFIGKDSTKWASFVKLYSEVLIQDIYPEIDIHYYFDNGLIRYDYIAKPGANLAQINLKIKGTDGYKINEQGELTLKTSLGKITHGKLYAYQNIGNRKTEIACSFTKTKNGKIGVISENYDPALALVIDPLVYSTFIGGNGSDFGLSMAIDDIGNAFVTGYTNSNNFPTSTGAYDESQNDSSYYDVFITKLNYSGSNLLYSTFIGGSANDYSLSIVLDGAGNAFITGYTQSTDYPTTTMAYDTNQNGVYDAYVTKLNAAGSALVYSTYIGGSILDYGSSIAIDSYGNAFITGYTASTNYPTTSGAYNESFNGNRDVFVTKLNASGSALIYSTYIGGSNSDECWSIAIDVSGNAFITGYTASIDYPITNGAYSINKNGLWDIFVTKLNITGSALVYSTFIGGSNYEEGYAIKIDKSGNSYITGYTQSPYFPTTSGAFQLSLNGYRNAFLLKLNTNGSKLVFSTYIGGGSSDQGNSIAIDSNGNICITGLTESNNYPTTDWADDLSYNGGSTFANDGFVTIINATGTALIYSSFLGGSNDESCSSIVVDISGNVFVTGSTNSTDFPTNKGAYNEGYNGGTYGDVFVTKISQNNQAVNLNFSNVIGTGATCKWTKGAGTKRVAFIKQGTTSLALPVMNLTYSANSTFGLGTQVGTSGWYCVYNDTGSTITVTGLSPNNIYKVMVCEYRGAPGSEQYITDSVTNNPKSFTTINIIPSTQASNLSFNNIITTGFSINCTKGNGIKRAFFVKAASSGTALPVNNTTYTANTAFGSGIQIGSSGWYCVYNDTGRSVTISNLQSGSAYTVMVCEYDGNPGSELYNTTSATDNPKSTSTTVGINDNQLTNINIYPNPTNGLLVIENAKGYYLTIFNSLGKSVYTSFVIDDTYTADLNNFADGMYFLKLDGGVGSISQKIILRR